MMKAPLCSARALLLLVLALSPALAQSPSGTLGGRVTDTRGDVVAGAMVAVTNTETGLRREAETDGEGIFTVALLAPGRYSASIAREGFKTVDVVGVEVHSGERHALRIALAPGEIAESVTIDGTSLVETESTALGARIERKLLENLPLLGRSFTSILTLAPGVIQVSPTANNQGQFSVNGQRTNANYFTVDGVSVNFSISGNLPGLSALGGTNNLASIDAIQEVSVLTSTYASEYGRTSGGQVSVVTRSGTNEFHGSASEYLRNDALDANDWFVNRSYTLEQPPTRSNQFGAVFGGPLARNRTFFFFSYEGQRLLLGKHATRKVPSLELRRNAPAWLQPLANAFPVPTGSFVDRFGLAKFEATYSEPSSLDATAIRIDHALGERVTLFGRYNYSPSSGRFRGDDGATLNDVEYSSADTHTLTIGSNQLFGSRVVNALRLNYSRYRPNVRFIPDDFGGAMLLPEEEFFPGRTEFSNTYSLIFIDDDNYITKGAANTSVQRQWNFVDHMSIVAGPHQLGFGVDYRRNSTESLGFGYILQQTLSFNNPTEAPILPSGTIDANSGISSSQAFTNLSLYAQDAWKATPRLTLTYGLRWEVNFAPTEGAVDGRITVVGADDPATMRVAPAGSRRYDTTYGNVAVRLGGAYTLSDARGRETVLRGGGGVFYDIGPRFAHDIGPGFALTSLSSSAHASLAGQPYPVPDAALHTGPLEPPEPPFGNPFFPAAAVDATIELPRTYEVSATLERALGVDQTLSVSYVGAFGRKLLTKEVFENPNPTFVYVTILRNGADSDYNALQVHFQRRVVAGLGALASYTWSHAIDTASYDAYFVRDRGSATSSVNRASASFDARHAFSAAVTYDLPSPFDGGVGGAVLEGWSTDWVARARSAYPVDVVVGGGPERRRELVQKPNYVPGVPIYVDDPQAPGGRRINRAAFEVPASGQGNVGRNSVRGFGAWQLDLALRRRFALSERFELQFRAEAFNVLNHPNFGGLDPVLASDTFGEATGMLASVLENLNPIHRPVGQPVYQVGGPRSIQLALKLQF